MPKRGKCEAFHATEIEENTKGVLKGFINRENVSIITASKRSLQPSSRKEKHLEKQIVSLRVLEKEVELHGVHVNFLDMTHLVAIITTTYLLVYCPDQCFHGSSEYSSGQ